ncbi:MAG TPA: glutamate synthase-related protein, partial [Bacteroidia bacterium]|nr:glutamate synthase-related protein [Bacteroidia bacterium]
MRSLFVISSILMVALAGVISYFWHPFIWSYILILPIVALGIYDMEQPKHSLMANFPVVGRFRWVAEWLRPKIYQYFVESDTDGAPFNRLSRTVVYQRSKKTDDTMPFGTQMNVYETGYEWLNHSIAPLHHDQVDHSPRVTVGGPDCKQPYSASIYNVSAMSFGSLSKNAIMALNGGAKLGGFAHNTGEGGLSPYHLSPGGDIFWQIGTGYF